MKSDEMNLIQRVQSPTPKLFRIIRTIGLCLAAAGTALLSAPVTLPVTVATVAGYLAVAGGIMTAVSQAVVQGE